VQLLLPCLLIGATVGGVMSVIIPRGTQIPTKKSQIFTTSSDKQSTVSTKVL
jgi:molecular chaperone DnaK